MASIDLTVSHQSLLTALVNLYRQQKTAVKGEAVAGEVDRAPGTVRNQMQMLKSLGLVEAVSGPRGGYKPTAAAYEALEIDQIEHPAAVPVRCNDDRIDKTTVETIRFTNVDHPERCRAEIRFLGSFHGVHHGDELQIGPTPRAKLVITGTVEAADDTNNIVILEIEELIIEATTE